MKIHTSDMRRALWRNVKGVEEFVAEFDPCSICDVEQHTVLVFFHRASLPDKTLQVCDDVSVVASKHRMGWGLAKTSQYHVLKGLDGARRTIRPQSARHKPEIDRRYIDNRGKNGRGRKLEIVWLKARIRFVEIVVANIGFAKKTSDLSARQPYIFTDNVWRAKISGSVLQHAA